MKIALLADIHGNMLALDAVLTDLRAQGGVDACWVLGDLVAIGAHPIEVLETLNGLPDVHIVRGNTDRYTCSGDRPPPTQADVSADPDLLPTLIEVEADFSWTQGAVTISGWLDWLDRLPINFEQRLPDGSLALCVHASPGRDDGPGFQPDMSATELSRQLGDCAADLICVGHTHRPFHLQAHGKHIINPGSVSNPVGDLRASYAVLHADPNDLRVEHRRAAYDYQAYLAELDAIRHPARAFIRKHYRGASP